MGDRFDTGKKVLVKHDFDVPDGANTAVFTDADDVTALTATEPEVWEYQFLLVVASVVWIGITSSSVEALGKINNGVAIAADTWHQGQIRVEPGDIVNFEFDTAGATQKFRNFKMYARESI